MKNQMTIEKDNKAQSCTYSRQKNKNWRISDDRT